MPLDVADLETVPIPVACLACGTVTDRPGATCTRCGLTEGDRYALLRAAVDIYAKAHAEAIACRYEAARTALSEAASLGLAGHPALEQLLQLINRADIPVLTEDAASYATARRAALAGRFSNALPLACGNSPLARELHNLCLVGARWQRFFWYRQIAFGVGVGAVVIALASKAFLPVHTHSIESQRGQLPISVSPSPIPSPSPVPTVPVMATTKQSEEENLIQHYPYPERLARRYFNDALAAQRDRDYEDAARLADAAADVGKNTYIQANALLLRAQIADTIREGDAAERWAKIAAAAPDSPYAPLGLLRAAECAENLTATNRVARSYYLRELFRRYSVSKEARLAKKRFGPLPE